MAVKVNGPGESYARSLVRAGKINRDGSWSFSAEDGNKLLESDGTIGEEYKKHFLGRDGDEDPETKAAWKYPFSKNGTIYRRGVIAVKSRAAQQGASSIAEAANRLLESIDKKKDAKESLKMTQQMAGKNSDNRDERDDDEDDDEQARAKATDSDDDMSSEKDSKKGRKAKSSDDDEKDEKDDKKACDDLKNSERQRIATIMRSPEAQGRRKLAEYFAYDTAMTPEQALKALAAAPKAAAETKAAPVASASDEPIHIPGFTDQPQTHSSDWDRLLALGESRARALCGKVGDRTASR